MSVPETKVLYSVEEYLALEGESEERHEYLDGEIYEMAGESPQHGAISMNLNGIVHAQLLGTHCQAFSKDTKIRSGPAIQRSRSPKGLFSYPDLVVVCGEMKFHDEDRHVLLNPTAIIEVLSPATEAFDRGVKWARYQTWLPELTDYLLVSQSAPQIDHFHRESGGQWLYSLVSGLDSSLYLTSINCTLRLADVYDRIAFPAEAPESDEAE
jgi:Uma2 family endonuclease